MVSLYKDDCSEVYFKLEVATRGIQYVESLKTYQRSKDGRGEYFSLLAHYCGEEKWETKLKETTLMLQTLKWRGQSNYPL